SVQIDPDNSVHELKDQYIDGGSDDNNRITIRLTVKGDDDHGSVLPLIAMGLSALCIACMAVLLVLAALRRKKERCIDHETRSKENEKMEVS
ncbi:MAG: hypothetical protein ACMUFK_00760, partial [Thermoplasmatota archaeon]